MSPDSRDWPVRAQAPDAEATPTGEEQRHPYAFDVVEVISIVETGHTISHGRWVAEMHTSEAVFRRAHEMARNIGGVVIASAPTVLGDYR